MTGAPYPHCAGVPDFVRITAAPASTGRLQATNPEDLLRALLDSAARLQAALLTQDTERVELLSLEGERLAGSLLAATRDAGGRSRIPEAPGLLAQLRSLHETNTAIVRSRVIYLKALQALLHRSATYDTNGSAPSTTQSTIVLKA